MIDSVRPTPAQVTAARAELREREPLMQLSAKAGQRWTLLLSLERNPEVAQLAAAGVAHRSIDALYPQLNFSDLIPGMIEVITPDSYAELDGSEKWQQLSVYPGNIMRNERKLRAKLDAETSRLMASGHYQGLRSHIFDCLGGPERERRAKLMALGIWRAYWGMQHLRGSATREYSTHRAFVEITKWALPGLVLAESPKR